MTRGTPVSGSSRWDVSLRMSSLAGEEVLLLPDLEANLNLRKTPRSFPPVCCGFSLTSTVLVWSWPQTPNWSGFTTPASVATSRAYFISVAPHVIDATANCLGQSRSPVSQWQPKEKKQKKPKSKSKAFQEFLWFGSLFYLSLTFMGEVDAVAKAAQHPEAGWLLFASTVGA